MKTRYKRRASSRWLGSGRQRLGGQLGHRLEIKAGVEELEPRVMLDANLPPAIVLGRTLSAYTIGGIQNNQETITLTVYNEQSKPVTGVLVTDTLEPGVTLASASQLPDQSGQDLAWSLGTINGFDRASITLTVSLPDPIPLQLDAGAHAFATLDAGMVTNSTPAAVLRPGSVDASLLASTPDANITDPFIQEQAAALSYNAQNIFNFLHNNIVYNSYLGSVRGARGTLWSSAGNALDVASLGVALMRESGIPAQYVQGTLSSLTAQSLILSMFPASYQLAGYIPAGTATADPAHDPQLLAETESHYWFQFDTGSGFQNADPLMSAFVGSTFASSPSTFTEVPDILREKTEISVNAEIYSQANAAFGGTGLTDTTVLDQTFNDVDLVGRPLTFGNYVNSVPQGGLVFLTVTNTYTPYIDLGDDAYPAPSQDEVIEGTPYQELLTNFPLGSQFLTGLFLNIQLSGPQGPTDSYERSLVDRIGFAARQAGGTVQIAPVDPTGPPVLSSFDTWNLSILVGLQSAEAAQLLQAQANQEANKNSAAGATIPQLVTFAHAELAGFSTLSDRLAENTAALSNVLGYFDRPRVTMLSSQVTIAGSQATVNLRIDLINDLMRSVAFPGQNIQAALTFAGARGFIDTVIEGNILPAPPGSSNVNAVVVIEAAQRQGVPLAVVTSSNIALLQECNLPSDTKARIVAAVNTGLTVIVPTSAVLVNGRDTTAWLQLDPRTGEIIGVGQDGGHLDELEYVILTNFIVNITFISVLYTRSQSNRVPSSTEVKGYVAAELPIFLSIAGIATGPVALIGAVLGLVAALDPPLQPLISNESIPLPINPRDEATSVLQIPATSTGGDASSAMLTSSVTVSNEIAANWTTSAKSSFSIGSLNATSAHVLDANGDTVGSGAVTLATTPANFAAVSGNASYSVIGQGSLSFFGPAESSLGVSGDWNNYTAIVSGDVSIVTTTDDLTVDGHILPAGTYTISTSSATLTGSGTTASPSFSGSASVTATSGLVYLGKGTGSVTVGGGTFSPTNGVTLTGVDGNLTVSATGMGTDSVSLSGSAANVLTVSANPTAITTDQNTPVTFQTSVQTSFADTYTITAQAPTGWTVSVDNAGNVTVTPAPGLQSGTYPIRIVAQSTTNPDLVAQTTVNVTLKSALLGITLNVAPDPLTTVPFNGAQLPTAFTASIHNISSRPLTENLSFSNIPSGFALLDSATSITIPAGQTGSVGVYLMPTSQIPAPGSQFSFNVSTSDIFGDHASQAVSFTVPAVDAITLSGTASTVNIAPGATATDVLTIVNAGNVPEDVTLSSSAETGLTIAGLSKITLQPGQSVTENVTYSADSSVPLNSLLGSTITATYGPSASPQTASLEILADIVVPGASAISSAIASADQLGESDLAARLNDLSTELTSLVLDPTSPVAQSQLLATLDALLGLVPNDVYLAALVPALTADRTALAQAVTSGDLNTALTAFGSDLGSVATTLSNEIAHSLVLTLDPNQGQARPQVPVLFPIAIQNTGNQPTTYDFSVSGLPASVDASFNYSSVTLQPGQYLFGGPNGIVLTLTETGGELVPTGFTVTATAEGAPEINRSAAGSLTVRNAFVQVTTVTPSPSFTDPGGTVDISARILNVTANPITAEAYYTVSDPGGNVVFTSGPVSVPFSSFVSFPTVDLGSFDSTGLAEGSYTISVMVSDAAGKTLTNVPGNASVQVGSPVTASLALANTTALPNFSLAQTLTSTLKIDSQSTFAAPLTLDGIVTTDAPETAIALDGTLAYVVGTKDVSIIDVSDPTNPVVKGTFGGDQITQGGYNVCKIAGNLLLIGSQNTINTNYFNFLIYDITNRLNPVLISNTQINYHFISDMFVEGTTAYFPLNGVTTFVYVAISDQYGDFLAVDFSNPAQPSLEGVLFNNRGAPDGGDYQENGEAVVNSQLTYIATTTSHGADSQVGSGELLMVDTSDPSNLSVAGTLTIPDTVQLVDIVVEGSRALAVGSTGGSSITSGAASYKLFGNLTLTLLDISDPLHPKILGPTFVTQEEFLTRGQTLGAAKIDAVDLGNGIFAVSGTQLNGSPEILLVDTTDPNQMVMGTIQTPSIVNGLMVSGGLLYGSTQDGLSIYNVGQVHGIPMSVSVALPTGTPVNYNLSSFNIAPSQIVHGGGYDTITWFTSLGAGVNDLTLKWTSSLASNQPAESLPVALGATVGFNSQGTIGTLSLPGTDVTVTRYAFLAVIPSKLTVQPGGSASSSILIERSTSTADTYSLSVVGVPASWVTLPSSVTLPAGQQGNVPLVVHPDPSTLPGTYNFTLVATDGLVTDSYQVTVTVQGQAIVPPTDPNSHGIVAELVPVQSCAGQGTSTAYTIRLTNTGSADDTFSLSAAGLPVGVTAVFGQTTIDVPPGSSSFRDVLLTLTPPIGLAAGNYDFNVTATSTAKSSIAASTSGTLDVLGSGVSVALNPPSGAPGSPFQMTVTNTGQITDTFDLALGGPAGIVSQLSSSTVTLAPGDSQVVPIGTGAINFAVPGNLELAALATSETDPAVLAGATAQLNIPETSGMTADFSTSTQILSVPGSADFLLLVNNTGNVEDAYSASIVGTTGQVTASLAGLTGAATQTIPIFRLPGLSTGAILLTANLGSIGQGTVTVEVKSLNDGTIISDATATIIVDTQAPTSGGQDVTTAEGSQLEITLTGTDPNSPPLPVSYVITSAPSHGTLSGTAPNLTYTPAAGYFGSDSFSYKTNNGYLDSAISDISIDIVAPPAAQDSAVNIAENVATSISLSASDPNTPNQPLTYIITSGPAHGTLGPISGGSVIYTPDADYFGPDSFQFKVNNGVSDSQIATVSLDVQQAVVSDVFVHWGTQAAVLQTNSDGLRLLPAGRNTDLPWRNISSLAITLNQAAALTASDVTAVGITGGDYGPVTISGSGTSYVVTFAKPVSQGDLVTITIGNTEVATFTRRVDILPGDTNDDGVVNTTDGVLILYNTTPAHPYDVFYDFNGDGAVNMTDFVLYRPLIGTILPSLPPQLAAGGEGPGNADRLTQAELTSILPEAIEEWAAARLPAAEIARMDGVTAKITALPPGYLGGAPIGGSVIYLSPDAAGYGWFVDAAPWSDALAKATVGHEDLLTVVMHELGHVLGLNDLDPATFPDDLLAETLATGVRRLPSIKDVMVVLAAQPSEGDLSPARGRVADAVFAVDRSVETASLLQPNTGPQASFVAAITANEHAVNFVAVDNLGKQNARARRYATLDAIFGMDD